ncbi:unnamed protein product [Rhodiola kirilowii]
MNPENQGFMSGDGLGNYQYLVPQPQFSHGLHFQPVTQVENHGGLQFNDVGVGGYQSSLGAHCQFNSGLNRQPASNRVIQQVEVPKLTPQQKKKHSVWLEMVKQGSGFKQCSPPFEWSEELHRKFMEAVNQLGGLYKAKPSSIHKKMCGYGLTRLTIKSHLQTCRRKEKTAGTGSGRCESSMGRREQVHVQNEVASESLVNKYSSGVEKETMNNLISARLKFLWDELDREINEDEYLEFTTPIFESHSRM